MDTREILAVIDAEIERLQRVRELLSDAPTHPRRGRPATGIRGKATSFNPAEFAAKPKRRTLSAAARKKIAAAQKKRWAAIRQAKKNTAGKAT